LQPEFTIAHILNKTKKRNSHTFYNNLCKKKRY
jgi:hypothetical protein